MSDAFQLHPVGELEPRTFLSLAESGRLHLEVPLPRQKLRLGFVEREWFGAHVLVIDLTVRAGLIDRSSASVRFAPELTLPLGMSFRGLRLSAEGAFILELSGLGDIDLNRLLPLLPRIPEDPVVLWKEIEGRLPKSRRAGGGAETRDASASEASALAVRVSDLRPFPGARLDLGAAGYVCLTADTRIDVHTSGRRVELDAKVVVDAGALRGPHLSVVGIAGEATVKWVKADRVSVSGVELQVDGLSTSGSALDLDLVNAQLKVPRYRSSSEGQDVVFTVAGELAAGAEGKWEISKGRAEVEGHVQVRDREGVVVRALRIQTTSES